MKSFLSAAALALLLAAPAAAKPDKPAERPQALVRLVECRAIAAEAERLACYDREVAAVDAAAAARDLVVVDREDLRKTRRTLFGLTLPDLSVFGDDNEDKESVGRLETTIKTVRQDPYGRWHFELADGALWSQIDSRELPIDPRAGQAIRIRRAAMGSFLANVNNQTAIRVRRER